MLFANLIILLSAFNFIGAAQGDIKRSHPRDISSNPADRRSLLCDVAKYIFINVDAGQVSQASGYCSSLILKTTSTTVTQIAYATSTPVVTSTVSSTSTILSTAVVPSTTTIVTTQVISTTSVGPTTTVTVGRRDGGLYRRSTPYMLKKGEKYIVIGERAAPSTTKPISTTNPPISTTTPAPAKLAAVPTGGIPSFLSKVLVAERSKACSCLLEGHLPTTTVTSSVTSTSTILSTSTFLTTSVLPTTVVMTSTSTVSVTSTASSTTTIVAPAATATVCDKNQHTTDIGDQCQDGSQCYLIPILCTYTDVNTCFDNLAPGHPAAEFYNDGRCVVFSGCNC